MSYEYPPQSWVTCPHPNPQAALRLFCFPYAGGGASIYSPWAFQIPEQIEVYGIQYPGRENRLREPPLTNLSELVQILAPLLAPLLDRPFAFFGHSLGGIIAYELIRHLRSTYAREPLCFFASACRAPHLPLRREPVHHLPYSSLVNVLRDFRGTPEAILQNKELMDLLLPVLRADMKMFETYTWTPGTPLACRIVAFGGRQDREVRSAEIEGWREHTAHSFLVKMFAGGHFFLQNERQELLQIITQETCLLLSR